MASDDRFKDRLKEFPDTAGVYLMKDDKDRIIYVGKAKNLKARVRSYFQSGHDHSTKTKRLVMLIHHIDYMLTKTEVEAFLLEASLIKKHRPRYNIRLKDDKAYPYIRVSLTDDFPRLYVVRRVKNDGAMYFGPYTSGYAVRETIRFLNMNFKIRDCSDTFFRKRTRPCMTYQIGRCTAPCVDLISKEDYNKDIKSAVAFLGGKGNKTVKDLEKQMKALSKEERYEMAAKIRDSIKAIEAILEKQAVVSEGRDYDQDIIAFHGDKRGTLVEILFVRAGRVMGSRPQFLSRLDCTSPDEDVREWLVSFLNQYYDDNMVPDEIVLPVALSGDLVRLLQAVFKERQDVTPRILPPTGPDAVRLQEMCLHNAQAHFQDQVMRKEGLMSALGDIQRAFGLKELPVRIECYDNSNFQGDNPVASQVVFEEGLPKKEDYKRYKIKTVVGANDFASMKEVLSRRFKHTEWEDPQLIVVDGGKGQLKLAMEALKEVGRTDIPIVSLAKAKTLGDFTQSEVKGTEERFFIPGRQNPITFPANSEAYQILVSLRDEAHRFAITFHRKLRDKSLFESELDAITGLGESKKKLLLKKFGSVDAIRAAPPEELMTIKGINRLLAERIILHLQQEPDEAPALD